MTHHLTTFAKDLRKESTYAERRLWSHLRNRQLLNLKFRRQQPIGDFIVDFICFEKNLIIEIDGGQHSENERSDSQRTFWLNEKGYKVIRFWNHDVLKNCIGVLEEISRYCK